MSYTIQSESNARRSYDELLDDVYPTVKLGYSEFYPSEVMRQMDPTAYEEGFTEYCDTMADDGYYVEGYTDDRMEPEEQEAD
jgi:hypothetical protein